MSNELLGSYGTLTHINLILINISSAHTVLERTGPLSESVACAHFRRYTACKAFLSTLNEMNDYAGQHEVISENMTSNITVELARYVQELKQERKSVTEVCFFLPKRWTRGNGNTPRSFQIKHSPITWCVLNWIVEKVMDPVPRRCF